MSALKPGMRYAPTVTLALAMLACTPVEQREEPELARLEQLLQQCQADSSARRDARTAAVDEQLGSLRAELQTLGERFSACERDEPATPPAPVLTETAMQAEVEEEPEKLIIGRQENVWVEDLQLALPARIDTGAETASLDARNITFFERDGKSWVRFDIRRPKSEEMLTLERPQVREALVVQSNSEEPERRPVINLGIQIGSVRQLAEFTLSDRSHLDYQMLVGRNILRDVMLVDVSSRNLVKLPKKARSKDGAERVSGSE